MVPVRRFLAVAVLVLVPALVSAARLSLRDGSVIYGEFVSGSPQGIVFRDANGVRRRFDLQQVQNIDFGNFHSEADREEDPVLPAGASLSLRATAGITAASPTWSAVIVQDVLDEDGHVAVPKGTPATLAVRRSADGSRYVLDLDSIELAGRRCAVNLPAGRESALGTLIAANGPHGAVDVVRAGAEIRVPAETVLNFRLEAPLHLREDR
jgi:hypothetical protein